MKYRGGHSFEMRDSLDGRSVAVYMDGQQLKAIVAARYEPRGSMGVDTLELTFNVAEFITTKQDSRGYLPFVDAYAQAASQDVAGKFAEAREAVELRYVDAMVDAGLYWFDDEYHEQAYIRARRARNTTN